ncbi:(Fe-S)-binding protein [Actinomyces minihominis]|uniref:(Fe-S)-binding protein n=1 Tax=Actinomyces minihominis TaxID=2002838 RepID=UPI000C075CF7|nr:(Fe-S)-binding protein [Actinomyces minihominis]
MASDTVTYLCVGLALLASVAGVSVFIHGVARIISVAREGAPESGRWNQPWLRIWTALRVSLSHSTFRNRPLVRVAHWIVMVSFVVLVLTLVSAYGQLFNPLYSLPVLGSLAAWNWIVEILATLGFLSIAALFVVRTVTMLRAHRDGQPRSSRFFGSTRWQAWFVEAVVAVVSLTILLSHGFRFALELAVAPTSANVWHYPLTAWFGYLVSGWSATALANALVIVLTVKIVTSMLWMLVVGNDIAMSISWHRFLAPVNIAAGRNANGAKSLGALALPLVAGSPSANLAEDFEALDEAAASAADEEDDRPPVIGLGTTADLTWKDRLDFMSCTECGRCQDLCPAWNTEKPLSPKLLTLALRDSAVSASGFTNPTQAGPDSADVLGALTMAKTSPGGVPSGDAALAPGVLNPDVLWDCTMCGACVDQCPVDIEHIDHIANMRRFQVLMESAFPRELARPFRAMETKSNPYNQSPRKRLDWAKNLDFDVPVLGEDAEDATGFDYLFWVGCAGAYDEKAKRTTAAVAELLHTAGTTFAVLGSGEGCTGDPARRAGNEILFQMLASDSIETLNEVKARRIVVTCAHCFNTIGNEFPQLGGNYEVIHHTQLLNRLVREGTLTPIPPSPEEMQTVTYHDPCFLGRHNRVFEAPRELLGSEPGLELVEMSQNRELAMCCGAGGARAWMEETRGTRIASARVDQALATGATTVATACPFCTQMLDSAVPSEAELQIKDVAVLLLEGVHRGQEGSRPRQ